MESRKGKPVVSIIITTRNEEAVIGDLLQSIKDQTYKTYEIIVVDNRSSDNTCEIARKYTQKVYTHGPERSAQRNFGAVKAKGKYLLFLDADMFLTKMVVEECVSKFQISNFKFQIGGIIIPERSFGDGFWTKAKIFERQLNEGEAYFEAARFFPRKIFREFKGYDETLTGPEDWDLHQRVLKKYQIERVKNYIKHNEGRQTLLGLAHKKFYYGLSAHKYLIRHNLSVISPATTYFLRPAFYRNWQKLIKRPFLTLGMIVMLSVELIGGGIGYLIGRARNAK